MHTHTHTYTYIHIHTHIYIYMHTHIYTYNHIHTHTHTYIYMYTWWYMCIFECDQTRAQILFVWHSYLKAGKVCKFPLFLYLLDIFANSKQGNEILTSLNIRKYKTHMIWPNRCFGKWKKENKIIISPISQEKTYCFELLHVTGKKGNKTFISLNVKKRRNND